MNYWLSLILLILIAGYLLDCLISILNLRALSPDLPEEFKGIFDDIEYARSQNYTEARTRLSLVSSTVTTFCTIIFILINGFNIVDLFVRSYGFGPVITGLAFTSICMVLTFVLHLPFSIYSTFVIEAQFGFNRTTLSTFILDICKSSLLAIVLGGPILALLLWFFETAGDGAWIYCWIIVVLFSVLIQFLAPVLIFPLFNTFSPLAEGELKDRIYAYAKKERFHIQGVFTMDGSKRSNKLNAFFTGFGRFRKIVFFDTLLEKLTTEEILAVLAHEMGHFKCRHIIKLMCASFLQTGIMFYILSVLLNNEDMFSALGVEHISVYVSLFFFGILFLPINAVVSILFHCLSRKHEYEADAYAVKTTGDADSLISGLKTLARVNLSNLTPHPAVVFLEYTHPPVLQRIKAVRKM